MANEQSIETLEKAKLEAQAKVTELEQTLQRLKEETAQKIQEIDVAITQAKVVETIVVEPQKQSEENVVTSKEKVEKPKVEAPKKVEEKKDEEKERIEKLLKSRENEKQQIAELKKNLANRTKGDTPAEPGNVGIKHTNAEVFVYIIDDNALQLKVLLEKFKTTRSFKKTKGFASGDECLDYIKKHKYPKNSMIMTVVDYYLDEKGNGEDSNTGIDVLHKLKDYDSDIEVIVLSGSDDVDIEASATHFGAVSFVKKGEDDFKKIVNNIVWAIHEKAKIRKKAETQHMLRNLSIGIAAVTVIIFAIYFISVALTKQ